MNAAREQATVLQNMSAPPHTTIALRPLAAVRDLGGGKLESGASGLRRVARVDSDALITACFPKFDSDSDSWRRSQGVPRDIAEGIEPTHLRLRCLVVLARVALGLCRKASRAKVAALVGTAPELLADELVVLAARIDPPLGLPLLGVFTPAAGEAGAELDFARALFLLTHRSGQTFVRDMSALVHGKLETRTVLDLWAPASFPFTLPGAVS